MVITHQLAIPPVLFLDSVQLSLLLLDCPHTCSLVFLFVLVLFSIFFIIVGFLELLRIQRTSTCFTESKLKNVQDEVQEVGTLGPDDHNVCNIFNVTNFR